MFAPIDLNECRCHPANAKRTFQSGGGKENRIALHTKPQKFHAGGVAVESCRCEVGAEDGGEGRSTRSSTSTFACSVSRSTTAEEEEESSLSPHQRPVPPTPTAPPIIFCSSQPIAKLEESRAHRLSVARFSPPASSPPPRLAIDPASGLLCELGVLQRQLQGRLVRGPPPAASLVMQLSRIEAAETEQRLGLVVRDANARLAFCALLMRQMLELDAEKKCAQQQALMILEQKRVASVLRARMEALRSVETSHRRLLIEQEGATFQTTIVAPYVNGVAGYTVQKLLHKMSLLGGNKRGKPRMSAACQTEEFDDQQSLLTLVAQLICDNEHLTEALLDAKQRRSRDVE